MRGYLHLRHGRDCHVWVGGQGDGREGEGGGQEGEGTRGEEDSRRAQGGGWPEEDGREGEGSWEGEEAERQRLQMEKTYGERH